MSRRHFDEWCSKPGCKRLAIDGERFCDPCLEAEEERALKVKVERLPPTIPKAPSNKGGRPRLKGESHPHHVPIEKRLENCKEKFDHAQRLGDRLSMSQIIYYARRLAALGEVPTPEWASLTATWKVNREVTAAGSLAGRAGVPVEAAVEMFRTAYSQASVSETAGNITQAAKAAGVHRNTLRRMKETA